MLRSEVMKLMHRHQQQYLDNWQSDGSAESEATFNLAKVHNDILEDAIHRQEIAELREASQASVDADNFSVSIRSEVKTK